MLLNKSLNNVIQGAVLRNQIAGAKSDGRVTTAEAQGLISKARAGGVQPSELAALRQLALESRNSNRFDAGAKAALNNFLGKSADRSYASGRLPPEASLPQNLKIFGGAIGKHLDQTRLNALDKHFKKDDGRIGEREMGTILKNIFKDGNLSATERKYLQSKLMDPSVSAEAKKDIRLILSLVPGSRFTGDGIQMPPLPFPRPMPLPTPFPGVGPVSTGAPSTGGSASTGGVGSSGGVSGSVPVGSSGEVSSTGGVSSGGVSSTGGVSSSSPSSSLNPSGGSFPAYPTPPSDPKDLAAQNKFQEQMFAFQQASQNMNMFWNMMTTTAKAQKDTADAIIRNFR